MLMGGKMHCKMKNVFHVPEQICDPGYAIAYTPTACPWVKLTIH